MYNYVNATIEINGESIEIGKNKTYNLVALEGIESAEYDIAGTPQGLYDGDSVNGLRVASRDISIEGDFTQLDSIQWHREKLIHFFKPKTKGTLTVDYMGVQRKIDFYVRSFKCGRNHIYEPLPFLITLYCPDPYFKDAKGFSKNMAGKIPLLTSPFAIPKGRSFALSAKVLRQEAVLVNSGDKETGFIVEFSATGEAVNPKIENLLTGEYIQVNTKMQAGDVITISTVPGSKKVELRGSENTNITNKIDYSSTFFQIYPGENILKYSAEAGYTNLDVHLKWNAEYLGV